MPILPKEVVDLHDNLARRVKEYEHRTEKNPPIEVLNELRYGFRGLVEWCNDPDDPDAALQRVRHAIMCAYHDLVDGLLIQLTEQLKITRERYPEATVRVLGQRLLEMRKIINRVEEKVADSREHREKRAGIYEEIYDEFDVLAEELKFFDQIALPEIISEADRLEARERRAKWTLWTGLSIGVIGLILTIISLL